MNKFLGHLKTVLRHKWYVFRECAACGLVWQGLTHDLSKFSPTEFFSSVKYYQGHRSPIDAEKEDIGYSEAWLHHKGRNKHHWEYWTDFDFTKNGELFAAKIPYKYVVEMICDYIGASKAYSKDKWTQDMPKKYFDGVKHKRLYHPETLALIETFLLYLDTFGPDRFHKLAKSKMMRKSYEFRNED